MKNPKVSIIMLNWNGLKDTIECVESLKRISFSDYRVILVDNGSQGNDVETIKHRFGDYVHIIENDRNYGFAEGNNIGMRYALTAHSPDYLLLLNNDITVAPDFLTELVNVAENDREMGLLGPLVYDYYKPNAIRGTGSGQRINWWRGVTYDVMSSTPGEEATGVREADSVEGSCMLAPRNVLDKVGMLDGEYFAYWEETDWCVRIRKAGYRICCVTRSRIWHKVQPSYLDTRKLYYFLRNNILFMRKNADRKYLPVFSVYFLTVSLPLWSFKPFIAHPLGTASAVAKALLWNISHRPAKGQ
jgi:GT2 family glycosyltransferase